jgi:hypothetical protein
MEERIYVTINERKQNLGSKLRKEMPIQFATLQLVTLQLATLQLATLQLVTLQLAT